MPPGPFVVGQSEERDASTDDQVASIPPTTQQPPTARWEVTSHVCSRLSHGIADNFVTSIRLTIKEEIGSTPKPWQVSVMIDAIHDKRDIVVSAGTRSGKSLHYQLITLIKNSAIMLVLLPTNALMFDQVCQTINLVVRDSN